MFRDYPDYFLQLCGFEMDPYIDGDPESNLCDVLNNAIVQFTADDIIYAGPPGLTSGVVNWTYNQQIISQATRVVKWLKSIPGPFYFTRTILVDYPAPTAPPHYERLTANFDEISIIMTQCSNMLGRPCDRSINYQIFGYDEYGSYFSLAATDTWRTISGTFVNLEPLGFKCNLYVPEKHRWHPFSSIAARYVPDGTYPGETYTTFWPLGPLCYTGFGPPGSPIVERWLNLALNPADLPAC